MRNAATDTVGARAADLGAAAIAAPPRRAGRSRWRRSKPTGAAADPRPRPPAVLLAGRTAMPAQRRRAPARRRSRPRAIARSSSRAWFLRRVAGMGFLHAHQHPGAGGQQPDRGDPECRLDGAARLRDQPQHQRTDGVAGVTPVAVGSQRRTAPARVGDVGHRGDQVRVEQRHAHAHDHGAGQPGREASHQHRAGHAGGEQPQAGHHRRAAADAVRQRPGPQLRGAPAQPVHAGDPADLHQAQAVTVQVQREQHPQQGVGDLVGDTGLAKRREGRVPEGHVGEHLARRGVLAQAGGEARARPRVGAAGMAMALGARPRQSLAHEHQRRQQRDGNHRAGETQQGHARPVALRQPRGGQARQAHRGVAGELVDSGGEAALLGARDVHLAGDGHAPREALVHAEEQVGRDDPPPRLREIDQQRDGDGGQPAQHQHGLAPDALGQPPGDEVGVVSENGK